MKPNFMKKLEINIMPLNKKCIYECNKGIKCEYTDCNICKLNPKKFKTISCIRNIFS